MVLSGVCTAVNAAAAQPPSEAEWCRNLESTLGSQVSLLPPAATAIQPCAWTYGDSSAAGVNIRPSADTLEYTQQTLHPATCKARTMHCLLVWHPFS